MSNLINKSNHPVEVKKIHVRIWTLRDEIEAAIEKRITEEGSPDTNVVDVDIEDIKEFYQNLNTNNSDQKQTEDSDEADEDGAQVDSSGNPLDDDALAMMAAIEGGDDSTEETEESSEEESEEDSPEENTEENSEEESEEEEDDEAAAAASAMLADQGLGTEENSEDDDEAAAAAAAMLADQGISSDGDDDAAAAAAMLADQGLGEEEAEEEQTKREPFKRVKPHHSKMIEGFIMLADIQMDQALIFSRDKFIHGQNIIIEFLVTNPFTISANVINLSNISKNSKVISETRPRFRVQAKTVFQFPNERGLLREFLKSIEPEIPPPVKKVKKVEEDDDDDDDFGDLDF